MPFFTIVTVTYNAASVIDKTIDSVLSQTCRDYEYIIVDGQSSDDTVARIEHKIKLVEEGKVMFISEPDRGIYDGMNKAIRMAHGRYLLFLNADDVFASETVLLDLYLQLNKTVQADVVYGDWIAQTEHGEYHQKPGDLSELSRKWVVSHQATFVRTDVLRQHPFNLNYKLCADFEQLSSFYSEGRSFEYVPMVISKVPIDSGSSFRSFAQSKREHRAIAKTNRLQTEWIIFRIGCVHILKSVLPKPLRRRVFGFIAKHYKVM